VAPLVARVEHTLSSVAAELVFVDDSTDATCERIQDVARSAALPIRVIHRAPSERASGLGGAVLAGLRATEADWVITMDGDLQHPPELVPALLSATQDFDVVVATRYKADEGSAEGLSSTWRHVASLAMTTAAKAFFPRRLAHTSDPMSGYFALRRAAIDLDSLHPRGFKILLEILVRNPRLRVNEVPFRMEERLAGKSKASVREGLCYITQLVSLRVQTGSLGHRAAAPFARRRKDEMAVSR
jgi:dolichol-phosphate mannosyltransferase